MAAPSPPVGPDVNHGTRALGVIWMLLTITLLVVSARLWTQWKITRKLGLSDALMALSIWTILTTGSLVSVQYHYGWGRHFAYLSEHQQTQAIKFNFIAQGFGIMGSTWGRMSFIVLMIHLFGIKQWRRRALWALFWSQFLINGVVLITVYVQCSRVTMLWDFSGARHCWRPAVQTNLGMVHTAINGATDLFLTCLPATMLWNLQMKLRLKVGLATLLGLSLLAFIACVVKIVTLKALSQRGDYTYNTVPLFTWVAVEGALVDIAASVPLLRPLLSRFTETGSRATKNTHELHDYSNQYHGTSRAYSKHNNSRTVKTIQTCDTGSEDGILPMQDSSVEKGIVKQTSYVVEYDVEKQAVRK